MALLLQRRAYHAVNVWLKSIEILPKDGKKSTFLYGIVFSLETGRS
jgi:hypothetical protein